MRKMLAALGLAAGIGLVCCQGAGAVPLSATAMQEAAATASSLQPGQYHQRHTRRGVIKCYREFVVGRYVCHRYHRW